MENNNEMKWLIFHSLGRLMKSNDLDKICVKQICEEAHISRQTFYRYFPDKYSVINWHFDLIADRSIKEVGRTITWLDAHKQILSDFYEERSIYCNAYSNDYNAIRNYGYRASAAIYIDTLTNYKKINTSKSLIFQADSAALLCTNLSFKWWTSGMKENPIELAKLYETVLPLELKYTLETGV